MVKRKSIPFPFGGVYWGVYFVGTQHINDVIDGQYRLEDYQVLNFPGGWSFGDDLGSGKVFVNKLLYAKTPTGPLAS